MAAPGSMANGVLVFMPPNSAGILQQGQGVSGAISQTPQVMQYGPQQFRVMDPGNQLLGSIYPGSPGEQVAQLRKAGMMERFLKAQPKTLGAIQILTGLMLIGFGGVAAVFIYHYASISVIGGYPFWGGLFFVISGSLSVAAEKHHKPCLVRGSLAMNIISAIFSAIGILILIAELIVNETPYDYYGKYELLWSAAKGTSVMLLLLTILEFSITIITSHYACQAICYNPDTAILYRPYVANANLAVPSAQIPLPPPYTNQAYDPKEETERRAS